LKYFLAKSDPDTYGIDDLERDGKTIWDGVHNVQAINFIKTMVPGDQVFIYHSMTDKAIVGVAKVSAKPFENKQDPRYSWAVELKFLHRTNPVKLTDIKQVDEFKDFLLIRNPRLSTMAVPDNIAAWIEKNG